MTAELAPLVDRLKSVRLMVLGDVMLDEYIWGDAVRISPEAPVPVVRYETRSRALGGAANGAAVAATLGGDVSLCGVVGKDGVGASLDELLTEFRIRDLLVADGSRPTITKVRVMAGRQQVVRIDTEDVTGLTESMEQQIIDRMLEALDDCAALLISDYGKSVCSPRLLRQVIDRAIEKQLPIVVDPKGFNFEKYRGCTVVTPNMAEAEAAVRQSPSDEGDTDDVGRGLLEMVHCHAVLLTQGPQGMTLFRADEEPLRIPTSARNVFDVTGAGDTVAATLALSLGAGALLEDAARLANLAAGVVVGKVGTSVIEPVELLEAVQSDDPRAGGDSGR